MRNIIGLSSLALLALMSASGSCRAQVIYNDTVLRGCYSFLTTSVDTEIAATRNRAQAGTLCFTGNGALMHTSNPTAGLTGLWGDTNGTILDHPNVGGTYTVTNLPGDGMGTIQLQGGCAVFAFSINAVDNATPPMAHGFQFVLQKRLTTLGCPGALEPFVSAGNAYYQGP